MRPFSYAKVKTKEQAIITLTEDKTAAFIAGGTDLLGLMKDRIQTAETLIDINSLPLNKIETSATGVRIGALCRLTEVALHPDIQKHYPVISQAINQSASPQLRNMATVGGNLLQKVRCPYFRNAAFPCNKRTPGEGCAAINGYNRMHAILGTSEHCIAVHPSDLAVALTALDAIICIQGLEKERQISIHEFYLLPGDTPHKETLLKPGELIVAVEIPNNNCSRNSNYLKVRDRAAYEFALVSVALALEIENRTIITAKIAFGGVATKPWRAWELEEFLQNKPLNQNTLNFATELAIKQAKPQQHNQFKIELLKRAILRALSE
ncbi:MULTISPECIES: xanthine dehydrogenase family protein subunit M [unclassified Anabaena]|uniref:FAD binding domain-containing protein n=1 Tax=unclassified Anabaena TaxID=2619674 RepID=UPI00082E41F5|nr:MULTISPECIES: xanthine dehydrogenase family protein subunit M [unclassified Anabaena]